ncbi:MAG: dienelactone hydrolase family protein [Synechococcaceae cyanobacterium]|nr:dienelactone hydrolase family protein [Synechococcaceae cyanobacterium]
MGPMFSAAAQEVTLQAGDVPLPGSLCRPQAATGLVLFVHGSASSRFSSRNRFVAERLQRDGLATLLFDLLSEAEERIDRRDRSLRFDIPLLARRTVAALDAVDQEPALRSLPVGLFGASTGAAAALIAATVRPGRVAAVVSRGGRPDLAASALPRVACPTLLIVGGRDEAVLALNREAAAQMTAPHRLAIVPGATHLFEEPGTLAQAADLAAAWFGSQLSASPPAPGGGDRRPGGAPR